ncbi:hypothetical protein RUM43_014072 [Polyplax serrata]|uniref:tRNA (guanine(9)-N(1))-methyltransferase n=1 Tax=Polyplax serrata TaxID=468196 RepID=A0AAN8NJA4_POLSC
MTETKYGEVSNDFETKTKTCSKTEEKAECYNKLSKRQIKKLKKKEKWLSLLSEKRMKQKKKLKLRRQEAKEKNIKLGPTRKELKNCKMSTSNCKIKVALDFSFDHLMSQKDIAKCISQVLRCYSNNRRSQDPLQFYVVNFNGQSQQEMEKHNGYRKWDVNFYEKGYLDLFEKESLVYLTSDSHNVIETLEENKVYIIGALVDHNSQKGLCYKTAVEQGISHGQLPLNKHIDMKSRKVLAINHVFEILLHVGNGLPWKEAFLKVLPQRKGAVVKEPINIHSLGEI